MPPPTYLTIDDVTNRPDLILNNRHNNKMKQNNLVYSLFLYGRKWRPLQTSTDRKHE